MQAISCNCGLKYDVTSIKPLKLKCQHVFCSQCITQIFNVNQQSIQCPMCGEETFSLVDDLEIDEQTFLQIEFDHTQHKCEEHDNYFYQYCKDHNKVLCENCVNEEIHMGHDLLDLETFRNGYFLQAKELYLKIDRQKYQIGNRINFLKSAVQQIQDFEKQQRDVLQKSVDEIVKTILRQQSQKQKELDQQALLIQEKYEQQKVLLLLKANQQEIVNLIEIPNKEITEDQKSFLQLLIKEIEETEFNSISEMDFNIDMDFSLNDETYQQMSEFFVYQEMLKKCMSELTDKIKDISEF